MLGLVELVFVELGLQLGVLLNFLYCYLGLREVRWRYPLFLGCEGAHGHESVAAGTIRFNHRVAALILGHLNEEILREVLIPENYVVRVLLFLRG